MSVLRRAKLRTPDGTESIEYPLGVDAENVEVANRENLSQRLVRIDEDLEKNEEDIAAVSELAGTNKQNIGANEIRIDALERRSASVDKKPYYFDTVADMKDYQGLIEGDMAITLGYYEANDGGGAEYKIISKISQDDYQEKLSNNLYANLMINDCIRVKNFGAIGNGIVDDTDAIQKAMDIAGSKNKPLIFERGKIYRVDSTRNKIATNGYSTILYSYGALILRGTNVIIQGNGATLKNNITQTQYDNNDQTLGAVILISADEQFESKIGNNNNSNLKKVGQSVTINDLIIDGGAENINQTQKMWGSGHNNCIYGRGINCIFQPNITMTLNNTSIKNCLAEGISGGGTETSVFVNGGMFLNVFPSPLNLSGGIEILDGCVIDNPMAIEMNPSYPNTTQIVRNCTITSTYNDDNATYCIGAVGLTSTIPLDNSNIIIENNFINFNYTGNTQYKSSIFVFRNINNFLFKDNFINISTPNFANTSGYGGLFSWGNINKKIMIGNKIKYILPSTKFNSFSMNIYHAPDQLMFNEEISERNTIEIANILDLSGTNLITFPDLRKVKKDFDFIFHITVPSSSTTLIFRLMYSDNFNQMIISSPDGLVELKNFDIKGYNLNNSFTSLLENGSGNYKIPKQGRVFNLVQVDPSSAGESLYITSSATTDTLNLDIKLLCK